MNYVEIAKRAQRTGVGSRGGGGPVGDELAVRGRRSAEELAAATGLPLAEVLRELGVLDRAGRLATAVELRRRVVLYWVR